MKLQIVLVTCGLYLSTVRANMFLKADEYSMESEHVPSVETEITLEKILEGNTEGVVLNSEALDAAKDKRTAERPKRQKQKVHTHENKKDKIESVKRGFFQTISKKYEEIVKKLAQNSSANERGNLLDLFDEKYAPWFLLLSFMLGCNMVMFGIRHQLFNIFIITSIHAFKHIYTQYVQKLFDSHVFLDALSSEKLEWIKPYILHERFRLAACGLVCLFLSSVICWAINTALRTVVFLGFIYALGYFLMQEKIVALSGMRKISLLVILLVGSFILNRILYKRITRYMLILTFGFYGALLILLPASEVLNIGLTIPSLVLSYTTCVKESDISLNEEYAYIGVLMVVSIILQAQTTKKKSK
ncbi:uncharacterized protein NEMAJ01_1990 [Nematocida major]|uniref:uncharacterized protein n=1 Tax=Nematocida major TaxID=1912982 RepID=UPI0020071E95|nr:uncharacterized protein NEMAJ01_1990 [Nematocida major]KAH9387094.1 hypothetical protein NEMAJ01_1990 [Nematocida major]